MHQSFFSMLARLLSVTLVLLFKIVLYLSITCLCIQLSIVYSYQPAWLVCIRYIQCSVYTLQVYPVLGIYHIDISSARYIPYRYIQCSVCTLQVYPVLGTYPTDISRAWYIPYRYIQCSVHTLQIYPELGIYPTDISSARYIPCRYIQCSVYTLQVLLLKRNLALILKSKVFILDMKIKHSNVCMSDQNSWIPGPICLKFWLGNSVNPRKYLVLACYRVTHKGWDLMTTWKNMTISRLTKKSSAFNNVFWCVILQVYIQSEILRMPKNANLKYSACQRMSIRNTLHAKECQFEGWIWLFAFKILSIR